MTDLDRKEQFLFEEYRSHDEHARHVDGVHNHLVSFFLTFAGLVSVGLSLLLKESGITGVGKPQGFVGILFLLVATIGVFVVCVVARLRKRQLEDFRIINKIRTHFLGVEQEDLQWWNVVEFSERTLPDPKSIKSGTFFRVMTIMLSSSAILGLSLYFLVDKELRISDGSVGAIAFLVLLAFEIVLYSRLSHLPCFKTYDKHYPPYVKKEQ